MKRAALILACAAALAACSGAGPDEAREGSPLPQALPQPVSTDIAAPVLSNREEVIRYRNDAARMLLPPGDSLTVHVFARIDEKGVPHQPEVKQDVDARISGAAISVVQMMQFRPAQDNGNAVSVLLKIPVRFIHSVE